MQLEDTRELVGKTATDHRAELGLYAAAASSAVFELLNAYPDVELATLQFRVDADEPPNITITAMGRRGPLVDGEPGCSSCHVHGDQVHTEYCQLVDHASQLTHLELYGPATGPNYRPCSCSGLGINPDCVRHNYDPAEDGPVDQADAPEWVDDGCRCPTREHHLDGCPTLDPPLTSLPE
jgi:hypothetical protein